MSVVICKYRSLSAIVFPRRRDALRALSLATLTSAAMLFGSSARAATDIWLGNTAVWSNPANWSAGVPINGSTLIFNAPGPSGTALNNDLTSLSVGGTNADGIDFNASAGAYSISGNALTLASTGTGIGINDLSLNAITMSTPLTLGSTQTLNVGHFDGSLTLSGVISGSAGFTKTGSGLLTLGNGGNTFTGTITVNGGTLSTDGTNGNGLFGNVNNTIVLDGGSLRTLTNGAIGSSHLIKLGNGGTTGVGTLDIQNNVTLAAGVVLSNNGGTGSFVKTGSGILTLQAVNTYTGSATINQGTISIDRNNQGTVGFNSASALIMGGANTSLTTVSQNTNAPTLTVQSDGITVNTMTINGLTLNQGNSNIAFRSIGTSADTLALGAITHNGGGLINFSRFKDSTGSANASVTTTNANTNGILGGWAVTNPDAAVGGGGVVAATDWAVNDGTGKIVALPTASYTIPTGATPTLANNAANNVRLDTTSTGNVSLTYVSNVSDLNTIQVTDTNARTIAITSGNTLRLGSFGGIWKTQANGNALTIGTAQNTGTLTAGGAANTAGEIVFNVNASGVTTNGLTMNSRIADNGTGVVSITKTGQGSMDLSSTSTYTGNTYINQGRFVANTNSLTNGSLGGNGTTAGSGTIFIQPGGQLFVGVAGTIANNIVVSGNGTSENGLFGAIRLGNTNTIGTSTSTITLVGDTRIGQNNTVNVATFAGKITGNYNLEFVAQNNNTNPYVLSNTGNDFSGNIGVSAVNLGAGQTVANTGGNVTLRLGASEVIPNGAGKGNVVIGGGGTVNQNSSLDLNGFNETINGLVSVGTAAQTRVTNAAAGTGTATLTLGDGDATASFGGIIQNGATAATALTKVGAGTQTLSGANTYTGATTVNGGTLTAGAASALGGTSGITLNTGGTLLLGGSGSLNRANDSATVALAGGTISLAGLSSSSETLGALTLTNNSTIDFGIGNSNTLTFASLTSFTGTLTIRGWTGTIYSPSDATDNGSPTQDRLLFTSNPNFTSAQLDAISFFDDNGNFIGNGKQVNFGSAFEPVPVPEPTTVIAGLALLGIVGFRETRRLRRLSAKFIDKV